MTELSVHFTQLRVVTAGKHTVCAAVTAQDCTEGASWLSVPGETPEDCSCGALFLLHTG
jgi:hypothetical protein